MVNDWQEMCQLAFKARWFGADEERELMDIGDRENIRWGSFFEQIVLGSGVGGKVIELSDKEKKSEYYQRTVRQAETARDFLFKRLGLPFREAQVAVDVDLQVGDMIIPTSGNWDSAFGHHTTEAIIDTKYTADTTNTFGKYSWGAPEKMDMGQGVMYSEQSNKINGFLPRFLYYVADRSNKERVEVIEPELTKVYREEYLWLMRDIYIEISQAISFNYWENKASYNECKQCPLRDRCPKAVTIPEIKHIVK